MKLKIASVVALLFLFPLMFLFAGCGDIKPKVIDIKIELKENSSYEIDECKIELTFNNLKIAISDNDFVVTAIFDNNTTVALTNSNNGYKFESTIPNAGITPAGNYTLTFSYKNLFTKSVNVVVRKAKINLSAPVWSESNFEFDGLSHKPTIINLPQNVSTTYIYKLNGNVVAEPTEVGIYTASVILSTDSNHDLVNADIDDFNFEIKENPILKHNVFNSISLNNANLNYLDFVNMVEVPIYSTLEFNVKSGYTLYSKVGETFSQIESFNFINNNQIVEFYYAANDDLDNKTLITALTSKGNPLSFKLNNTDFTCDDASDLVYELSPNENSLRLILDEGYVNKFYISENNGVPKLLSNATTLIENVLNLSNLKIYFNNIELIEINIEQFEAIKSISVKTINLINPSDEPKLLTDNTFIGFNEFITDMYVTLKPKYVDLDFTTKLFTDSILLNELTDFTDLNINIIYLAVFDKSDSPVETVEIKINYTFGESDNVVTNFSTDEAYFVAETDKFEFVVYQKDFIVVDRPTVLLDGDEYPIFYCDDLIVTVLLEIIYTDNSTGNAIEYRFTKNIIVEFSVE